jgi:hypothetical protein
MMGIATVGYVISSLNIILVAKYSEQIPGGYWLLVVDAAIAGILGGKRIRYLYMRYIFQSICRYCERNDCHVCLYLGRLDAGEKVKLAANDW